MLQGKIFPEIGGCKRWKIYKHAAVKVAGVTQIVIEIAN
jgi:hypothetical protein